MLDVGGWLSNIPWEAIGIAASVISAIAASYLVARVLLDARTRSKTRTQLGLFLIEGQQLHNRCHDEKMPPPIEETQDWLERAHAYLADHLGDDYVATFHNAAGLPAGFTTIMSMEHSDVANGIKFRLARLQQFLDELRR